MHFWSNAPFFMLIRLFSGALIVAELLSVASCQQSQQPEKAGLPESDSLVTAVPRQLPIRQQPDTADVSRVYTGFGEGRDTTFAINQQRYRLLLRAETDSTKPLVAVSEGTVGAAFADDTSTFDQTRRVRGYAGAQIITLLDPAGRQVFRRRMRKEDFFAVARRDIVAVSYPQRPRFVGHHASSQTLAFTIDIGIPDSDVSQQCVLVLSLDGKVRRLAVSYASNWTAPDCEPRLLADGTVLTCRELLRPDGRRIDLRKSKSELVAALVLSDSTLCTLYQYGEYRQPAHDSSSATRNASAEFQDPEWVADPRKRKSDNEFIINTKGKEINSFRYSGFDDVIGYYVPRTYVWQTHSYYLLDEQRSLYLLDKHKPEAGAELPFRQMQHFRKPRRPTELRFTVGGRHAFYVDPAQPTRLRYERLAHQNDESAEP